MFILLSFGSMMGSFMKKFRTIYTKHDIEELLRKKTVTKETTLKRFLLSISQHHPLLLLVTRNNMWWLRFVSKLLLSSKSNGSKRFKRYLHVWIPFKGCFYHPCWHLFQSCHFYHPHVVYTDRWMRVNNQEVLVSNLRLGCSQGLLLSCMGWHRFQQKE